MAIAVGSDCVLNPKTHPSGSCSGWRRHQGPRQHHCVSHVVAMKICPPDPFQGGLYTPLEKVGSAGSLSNDLSPGSQCLGGASIR